MASFLGTKVKERTEINDEVIANNLLASSKAAANAYLNAVITCPTPELRAVFESSLDQVITGHSQLMELAVKNGWEKPYDSPERQLSETFTKSEMLVGTKEQ